MYYAKNILIRNLFINCNLPLKKHERLFILLDSTSGDNKLLRTEVYFEVLAYLLNLKHTRILVFDEKDAGKEDFYSGQLNRRQRDKMLFSKRQDFRKDLCLLSSNYVKLIFGPCTGLVHCASSIYNHFIENGVPVSDVPAMITYTGRWGAQFWWGNSPLVDCLLLREIANEKKLCVLGNLDEDEKYYFDDRLDCQAYTAAMLIDFIGRRLTP